MKALTRWLAVVATLGAVLTAMAQAPAKFQVRLDTSKGPIVVAVTRDWAPRGADRFYELVQSGYYDQAKFFRVVAGRWAQFGVAADPAVSARWRTRTFPDDPPRQSNRRGTVAFAFAVANGRTTQVFINLRDNLALDAQGFAPFGEVIAGMNVADALNTEYGEKSGGGIRAGLQDEMFAQGNAWLEKNFPRLDFIRVARLVPGN